MVKHIKKDACSHANGMTVLETDKQKCDQCNITENLRLCTSCGGVFCCQSGNAHNEEHLKETDHPIIRSLPPDTQGFLWCWKDHAYLE